MGKLDTSSSKPDKELSVEEKIKEQLHNIPRGRPKSGRLWKTTKTSRFSEIKKVKPLKTSWQQKMDLKNKKKMAKLFEQSLKEERAQKLQAERKAMEERKAKKLENEKKSEVVQTIKDSRKIKRMRKKQLRQIAKR